MFRSAQPCLFITRCYSSESFSAIGCEAKSKSRGKPEGRANDEERGHTPVPIERPWRAPRHGSPLPLAAWSSHRKPMKKAISSMFFALLAATPSAWSQDTPLQWWFDNPTFVVQPSDEIHVTATLTNTSAQPFTFMGAGSSFTGDLQKLYDFKPPSDGFLAPRGEPGPTTETVVAGHSSFHFSFGDLIPTGGSAPVGTYVADPALLQFDFAAPQAPGNTFRIVVVPEPSTLLLGGVGFAWLTGILLRWKPANKRAGGDGRIALRADFERPLPAAPQHER